MDINRMKFLADKMKVNTPKHKEKTTRELLAMTRAINEIDISLDNKETNIDQKREEDKFRNFFNDQNINVEFIDLVVTNNLIFWGGTIDGVIQFVYKVTPDEKTSGVEFNYLSDFNPENPDNEIIINKVESYYDSFYKYWRNNILSK
jgi:hypothetical protein